MNAKTPSVRPRATFFRRKYVLDRCLGGLLLFATTPLTLTLYVLVRLTSKGPGFYRQRRVGLNGRVFEIVKLRSMVVDAEIPGRPVWATKKDARVTPLGRVLRELHLDELPQLWNVFRGEMSLVGPRPERPEICEKLATEIDDYYQRNLIKPGVTGLAQINLPPDQSLEDVQRKQVLDLHYINHADYWLDTRMVFATALRLVGVKGEIVMWMMKLRCRHLLGALNAPVESDASAVSVVERPLDVRSVYDDEAGLDVVMAAGFIEASGPVKQN
ncbi:sugar transferase [Rubripirellula reticaptiva]|nr:sugar transferase [Rubripirellula reticaptiva]